MVDFPLLKVNRATLHGSHQHYWLQVEFTRVALLYIIAALTPTSEYTKMNPIQYL